MKKLVTLEVPGYNLEKTKEALIRQFIVDNPHASMAIGARSLGISQPGLKAMMNRFKIALEPPLSRAETAAMELLRKKGFTITQGKRVERRGRPKLELDYSPLQEVGGRIVIKGRALISVKRYIREWAYTQTEKGKFGYLEDSYGVTVIRKK